MTTWLEIGLSNALLATGLAAVAWVFTRFCRHPKVVFTVWLLVLARLLVPPLLGIPWQGWRVAALVDGASEETLHEPSPTDAVLPPPSTETSRAANATKSAVRTAAQPKGAQPTAGQPAKPNGAQAKNVPPKSAHSDDARPEIMRLRWPSLRTVVCATWFSGSALWLLLAGVRIHHFRRTLARAQLAGPELEAEMAAVARSMGLRRVPAVRLVRASVPPLVWAIGRATIVLPSALLARLSHEERATLLAHELAHLKRRDHLMRLLEIVALALYWWHPIAWWARRQMERAGEECCDALVVERFPQLARSYACALLATVDFFADARPALPVGSSGISPVPLLRRRLEMILAGTVLRRVNWPLRLSLAALAMIVLPPFIHSVRAAPKAFVPQGGTIEQRLDRLEKAMQELTQELRAMRKVAEENSPPTVVKTVPADGAEDVDPNLTEIKVTFSKDMQDGSWSWTQDSDDTFPEVTGKIHYEADKRTCVLPVKLEPGKTYHIGINSERFRNFKDEGRRPAIPCPLNFKTK